MKKGNIMRILIIAALAGAGLLFGVWVGQQHLAGGPDAVRAPENFPGTLLPEPRPLPPFSLQGTDGKPFDRTRLQGHWSLLFFGYTHCPDVCPATLTLFDQVARRLADRNEGQHPVDFVFVSVDPARDDLTRLKEYVEYFNPAFSGAGGDEEAIATLSRAFGAVYMRVEGKNPEDYLVDHTSAVFLTDPEGRFAGVFSAPHDPQRIAAALVALSGS